MTYLRNKGIVLVVVLLLPLFSQVNSMGEQIHETDQDFVTVSNYYPFDGIGHHPSNGDYNKVGSDLSRISPNSGSFEDSYILSLIHISEPTRPY